VCFTSTELYFYLAEIMEVCEIARALYSYNNHTGMKFDAGQLLNVFEKGEDGWCWGAVQQSEIEGSRIKMKSPSQVNFLVY
jgi:hypothetical protein